MYLIVPDHCFLLVGEGASLKNPSKGFVELWFVTS